MKHLLLTLSALTVVAGAAFAAPGQDKAPKTAKPDTKAAKTALICPVTGDKIASVKDSVGHSAYKGKTYYFCCAMCKPKFDKAPRQVRGQREGGQIRKDVGETDAASTRDAGRVISPSHVFLRARNNVLLRRHARRWRQVAAQGGRPPRATRRLTYADRFRGPSGSRNYGALECSSDTLAHAPPYPASTRTR